MTERHETMATGMRRTFTAVLAAATVFTAAPAFTGMPQATVTADAALKSNAKTAAFEFDFSIPSDWTDITSSSGGSGIAGVRIFKMGNGAVVEFMSMHKEGADFAPDTLEDLIKAGMSGAGLTSDTEPYITEWGKVAGRPAYYGTQYINEFGNTLNAYLINGDRTVLCVYQAGAESSGVSEWADVVTGGRFTGSSSTSDTKKPSDTKKTPTPKKKKTKTVSKKGAKSINSIISLAKKHKSIKGKKVYGKVKTVSSDRVMIQDPKTYYTITIYTERASSIKAGKKYAFKINSLKSHSAAYMDILVKGY